MGNRVPNVFVDRFSDDAAREVRRVKELARDLGSRDGVLYRVKAHDSSTHLPTWRDFMVIPANVYDALIAGTDNLFVDAVEISSSTTAANSVESNIGNLNATISSRSSHTAANVWTHTTRALTDKANFTLTSGERNSIADALLDRSNGIETGWTLRQAIRAILATSAGKMSGAGTGTVIFRNPPDTADRVEADVDGVGNRTNVTYNV